MIDKTKPASARSLSDVTRSHPETTGAIGALHREIMRRESPFSEGERELMASLVSALNQCRFCTGVHESAAEAFGVEPGLLRELLHDIDTSSADDRLKPVLKFVAKLALQPSRMVAADAESLLAAGWSDKAVYDAVCVCAFYSFMNRYVDGLGIEALPDDLARMGRQIAGHARSRTED